MRYRAQSWSRDEQSLGCTLVRVATEQPARPRTFRAFRDAKSALRFAKRNEKRLISFRALHVGAESFFFVNIFGSNPREKVKLAPARVIMSAGIVNELLA